MTFGDLVLTANRNLFRNRLRTFLTVCAIFVGAFTLTLTNGVGDGLKDYIDRQVKNYEGESVLFVRRKIETPTQNRGSGPAEYVENENPEEFDPNTIIVSVDQIERLAAEFPEVSAVSPNYPIRTDFIDAGTGKKFKIQVNAIARGVIQKLEAGGQISGPGQIILQYDIARALGPDLGTLIGREVIIGFKGGNPAVPKSVRLTVVGVATKGFMASGFSTVDAETEKSIHYQQRDGSPDRGKVLSFSFDVSGGRPETIAAVKQRLDEKGFRADTIADQSKRTYDAISIFQIGLNLFALIALLAASFGIINTLVIAVMERTKEIGLQKALGMGRGKVFLLFSLESILIGFWGAATGIAGAVVAGSIGNRYASDYVLESFEGYSLVAFKPLSLLSIMALICLIAFVAGVMPALRAARLNPIEALRYE